MQQSIAMKKAEQQEHWKIRQRELDLRASELQQQQQFQKVVLQQQQQFQQEQQAMKNAPK